MENQLEMFDDSMTDSAYINYINDAMLFSDYRMTDRFLIKKIIFWCDFLTVFSFCVGSRRYGDFVVSNKSEKEINNIAIMNNQSFFIVAKSDYPQKVVVSLSGLRYRMNSAPIQAAKAIQ